MGLRVAGLSLVERGVRTMLRAGLRQVLVVTPAGEAPAAGRLARLGGGQVRFARWGESRSAAVPGQAAYLLVRGEWVHHHSSLEALLAHGLGDHDFVVLGRGAAASRGAAEVAAWDGTAGACLCRASALPLDELTGSRGGLDSFLCGRWAALDTAVVPVPAQLSCRVTDRRSARRARDMLFGQVTRATSGTVARLLNVRLSVPLSRVLVEIPVSPNALSFALVLLPGLTAAFLVSQAGSHARVALAGLLWQLASVLDGCDGEVARVKLAETRFGAWLDTIVDDLSYVCGFVGLAIGVHRLHPASSLPAVAGLSSLVALSMTLGWMYLHAARRGAGSLQHYLGDVNREARRGEADWALRFVARCGFVAKRDFLALVLAGVLVTGQVEAAYGFLVFLFHAAAAGVAATHLRLLGTGGAAATGLLPLARRRTAAAGREGA